MKMASVELNPLRTTSNHECGGCGKRICDRFLLKAVDQYWHEDCLKCGCCDCRLGEVGSTLYKKANLLLCKRDYLRLFGTTGHCAACNKVIPAFEMVMRAKTNVYHLECFACQQCNHRFCVGDRFYLCDNKILCEYDYEERMVFANMSYSSDSLAHIKRQRTDELGVGRGKLQPSTNHSPVVQGVDGIPQPQFTSQASFNAPFPSQPPIQKGMNASFHTPLHSGPSTSGLPMAGASDDASSGYGSPDSVSFDDR